MPADPFQSGPRGGRSTREWGGRRGQRQRRDVVGSAEEVYSEIVWNARKNHFPIDRACFETIVMDQRRIFEAVEVENSARALGVREAKQGRIVAVEGREGGASAGGSRRGDDHMETDRSVDGGAGHESYESSRDDHHDDVYDDESESDGSVTDNVDDDDLDDMSCADGSQMVEEDAHQVAHDRRRRRQSRKRRRRACVRMSEYDAYVLNFAEEVFAGSPWYVASKIPSEIKLGLGFVMRRVAAIVKCRGGNAAPLQTLLRFIKSALPIFMWQRRQIFELCYSMVFMDELVMSVRTLAAEIARRVTRSDVMYEAFRDTLVVEWKPLYHLLQRDFVQGRRKTTVGPSQALYFGRQVVLLAGTCSRFFPKGSTEEILATFRPGLCRVDSEGDLNLAMLCTFLPTYGDTDPELWFEEMWAYWKNDVGSTLCNMMLSSLFAQLACRHPGKVDWTGKLPLLFTWLLWLTIVDCTSMMVYGIMGPVAIFCRKASNVSLVGDLITIIMMAMQPGDGEKYLKWASKAKESLAKPVSNDADIECVLKPFFLSGDRQVYLDGDDADADSGGDTTTGQNWDHAGRCGTSGDGSRMHGKGLNPPWGEGEPFAHLAGTKNVLVFMHQLLVYAQPYMHPESTNCCLMQLCKVVVSFARAATCRAADQGHMFCRCPKEFFLEQKDLDAVCTLLEPYAEIALHSSMTAVEATRALGHLACLSSRVVFGPLLERTARSLTNVLTTRHTLSNIASLTRVTAELLHRQTHPEGVMHLQRVVHLVLPGIDHNDLEKTGGTGLFLCVLTMLVPAYDVSNSVDYSSPEFTDPTYVSSEPDKFFGRRLTIGETNRAAVSFVKMLVDEWIPELMDRILAFFKAVDGCTSDMDGMSWPGSLSMNDSSCIVFLNYAVYNILQQCSDDVAQLIFDKFFDFVSKNILWDSAFSRFFRTLSWRLPKQAVERVVPMCLRRIREELAPRTVELQGGGPDFPAYPGGIIRWYCTILAFCIDGCGDAAAPVWDEVVDLVLELIGYPVMLLALCGLELFALMVRACMMPVFGAATMLPRRLWENPEIRNKHYLMWGLRMRRQEVEVEVEFKSEKTILRLRKAVGKVLGKAVKMLTDIMASTEKPQPVVPRRDLIEVAVLCVGSVVSSANSLIPMSTPSRDYPMAYDPISGMQLPVSVSNVTGIFQGVHFKCTHVPMPSDVSHLNAERIANLVCDKPVSTLETTPLQLGDIRSMVLGDMDADMDSDDGEMEEDEGQSDADSAFVGAGEGDTVDDMTFEGLNVAEERSFGAPRCAFSVVNNPGLGPAWDAQAGPGFVSVVDPLEGSDVLNEHRRVVNDPLCNSREMLMNIVLIFLRWLRKHAEDNVEATIGCLRVGSLLYSFSVAFFANDWANTVTLMYDNLESVCRNRLVSRHKLRQVHGLCAEYLLIIRGATTVTVPYTPRMAEWFCECARLSLCSYRDVRVDALDYVVHTSRHRAIVLLSYYYGHRLRAPSVDDEEVIAICSCLSDCYMVNAAVTSVVPVAFLLDSIMAVLPRVKYVRTFRRLRILAAILMDAGPAVMAWKATGASSKPRHPVVRKRVGWLLDDNPSIASMQVVLQYPQYALVAHDGLYSVPIPSVQELRELVQMKWCDLLIQSSQVYLKSYLIRARNFVKYVTGLLRNNAKRWADAHDADKALADTSTEGEEKGDQDANGKTTQDAAADPSEGESGASGGKDGDDEKRSSASIARASLRLFARTGAVGIADAGAGATAPGGAPGDREGGLAASYGGIGHGPGGAGGGTKRRGRNEAANAGGDDDVQSKQELIWRIEGKLMTLLRQLIYREVPDDILTMIAECACEGAVSENQPTRDEAFVVLGTLMCVCKEKSRKREMTLVEEDALCRKRGTRVLRYLPPYDGPQPVASKLGRLNRAREVGFFLEPQSICPLDFNVLSSKQAYDDAIWLDHNILGQVGMPESRVVYERPPQLGSELDRGAARHARGWRRVLLSYFCNPSWVALLMTKLRREDRNGVLFSHALMWKGVARSLGNVPFEFVLPYVRALVQDRRHASSHTLALEVIYGLMRGSKLWPYERVLWMWQNVLPIWHCVIDRTAQKRTLIMWSWTAVMVMGDRDVRRQHLWLRFVLGERDVQLGKPMPVSQEVQDATHAEPTLDPEVLDELKASCDETISLKRFGGGVGPHSLVKLTSFIELSPLPLAYVTANKPINVNLWSAESLHATSPSVVVQRLAMLDNVAQEMLWRIPKVGTLLRKQLMLLLTATDARVRSCAGTLIGDMIAQGLKDALSPATGINLLAADQRRSKDVDEFLSDCKALLVNEDTTVSGGRKLEGGGVIDAIMRSPLGTSPLGKLASGLTDLRKRSGPSSPDGESLLAMRDVADRASGSSSALGDGSGSAIDVRDCGAGSTVAAEVISSNTIDSAVASDGTPGLLPSGTMAGVEDASTVNSSAHAAAAARGQSDATAIILEHNPFVRGAGLGREGSKPIGKPVVALSPAMPWAHHMPEAAETVLSLARGESTVTVPAIHSDVGAGVDPSNLEKLLGEQPIAVEDVDRTRYLLIRQLVRVAQEDLSAVEVVGGPVCPRKKATRQARGKGRAAARGAGSNSESGVAGAVTSVLCALPLSANGRAATSELASSLLRSSSRHASSNSAFLIAGSGSKSGRDVPKSEAVTECIGSDELRNALSEAGVPIVRVKGTVDDVTEGTGGLVDRDTVVGSIAMTVGFICSRLWHLFKVVPRAFCQAGDATMGDMFVVFNAAAGVHDAGPHDDSGGTNLGKDSEGHASKKTTGAGGEEDDEADVVPTNGAQPVVIFVALPHSGVVCDAFASLVPEKGIVEVPKEDIVPIGFDTIVLGSDHLIRACVQDSEERRLYGDDEVHQERGAAVVALRHKFADLVATHCDDCAAGPENEEGAIDRVCSILKATRVVCERLIEPCAGVWTKPALSALLYVSAQGRLVKTTNEEAELRAALDDVSCLVEPVSDALRMFDFPTEDETTSARAGRGRGGRYRRGRGRGKAKTRAKQRAEESARRSLPLAWCVDEAMLSPLKLDVSATRRDGDDDDSVALSGDDGGHVSVSDLTGGMGRVSIDAGDGTAADAAVASALSEVLSPATGASSPQTVRDADGNIVVQLQLDGADVSRLMYLLQSGAVTMADSPGNMPTSRRLVARLPPSAIDSPLGDAHGRLGQNSGESGAPASGDGVYRFGSIAVGSPDSHGATVVTGADGKQVSVVLPGRSAGGPGGAVSPGGYAGSGTDSEGPLSTSVPPALMRKYLMGSLLISIAKVLDRQGCSSVAEELIPAVCAGRVVEKSADQLNSVDETIRNAVDLCSTLLSVHVRVPPLRIRSFLSTVEACSRASEWQIRIISLDILEAFVYRHVFLMTSTDLLRVLLRLVQMLCDSLRKVRERACTTFSRILSLASPRVIRVVLYLLVCMARVEVRRGRACRGRHSRKLGQRVALVPRGHFGLSRGPGRASSAEVGSADAQRNCTGTDGCDNGRSKEKHSDSGNRNTDEPRRRKRRRRRRTGANGVPIANGDADASNGTADDADASGNKVAVSNRVEVKLVRSRGTGRGSSNCLVGSSNSQDRVGWCLLGADPGTGVQDAASYRRAGLLGLCALIGGHPYTVPAWMPGVMAELATILKGLGDAPDVKRVVEKIFQHFMLTHADEWETKHKACFTEDQLAALTDVLVSPSYYA